MRGFPPLTPVDTLATAPLDPLIAATRSARVPGAALPRVQLAGPGARAILKVTALTGNVRPEFRVYALAGDLYFSLTGAAPDSTSAR